MSNMRLCILGTLSCFLLAVPVYLQTYDVPL
jgi:hypothetical protein